MLELRAVDFRYGDATDRSLRQVSLAVTAGRSLGIVGEAGSGKTTVVSLLLGLAAPGRGELLLGGTPVTTGDRERSRELRHAVQPVLSEASLDPRQRVDGIVGEPLLSLRPRPGRAARRERVLKTLDEVGLGADLARWYPRELTPAQRQRTAIARALAGSPQVLVADEPLLRLDLTARIELIGLLNRLRRSRGLGMVIAGRDLRTAAALCDDLVVLDEGGVVEAGPTRQVLAKPGSDVTRRLLAGLPRLGVAPVGRGGGPVRSPTTA